MGVIWEWLGGYLGVVTGVLGGIMGGDVKGVLGSIRRVVTSH